MTQKPISLQTSMPYWTEMPLPWAPLNTLSLAIKYEPPTLQFFPFLLLLPSFLPYYFFQETITYNNNIMLSTIPAMFSSETMIGNPFPSFENSFTPWVCSNFFSSVDQLSPKPVGSSSGSEEPNRKVNSDDSNQKDLSLKIDERKRRRLISNRESAKRSRMRKQKHLENLRNQVNRLKMENRELTNRLRFVLHHVQCVRMNNDRLTTEHGILRQKLSNIHQMLALRQLQQQFTPSWPCNTATITTNCGQIPSLIT